MKKIIFVLFVGIFCLVNFSFAGNAHKMIDKDYGDLYKGQALNKLAHLTRENLKKDSSGNTPYPRSESFYGSAPIHLYTAFQKAGYCIEISIRKFPEYLETLLPFDDIDRSKVYSLSRFIVDGNRDKSVDFGFKRKIDRNNGKEIAFADPETGKLIITGNCMNVIIDGEKVIETRAKAPISPKRTVQGWICSSYSRSIVDLILPLTLKSNYENETVVLSWVGQKKILLVWLEDADGKRVYVPQSEIILTDVNNGGGDEVNYLAPRFDPNTCTIYHTKWWDRVKGSDRGRSYKASEVMLNAGMITVSVRGMEDLGVLEIPWKVQYSKLIEKKRKKDVRVASISYQRTEGTVNGVLTPSASTVPNDRVVEVSSLEGPSMWRAVARGGEFHLKDIPKNEYLIQVFYFPKDNKGQLKTQIEYEEIVTF